MFVRMSVCPSSVEMGEGLAAGDGDWETGRREGNGEGHFYDGVPGWTYFS